MQSTLSSLLLITSTVVFACIVINYAAGIAQTTLQTANLPGLERLRNLQNNVLNQTNLLLNATSLSPEGSPIPIESLDP